MTRPRLLAIALVLVAAAGACLYVAYDQVLRGDAAPALSLPSVTPSGRADPTSGDPSASPADPSASTAGTTSLTPAGAAGTWTLTTGSVAGYRVRERLADLPAESDAIGRTDQVTGSVTIASSGDAVRVTAASIQVDTSSITSDKGQRDNRLRSEGLQTDAYPTASFTLTTVVDVPPTAFSGTVVDITLHGDLALHGTTKAVDIPARAQVSGGAISVQGAIEFPLSDFGITAPNIGGFIVSIADTGTLEFVAVLAHG